MPFVRYVLFTGGILLGLLFWTDWYFPKTAVAAATTDVDRSIIRIHSSHRWPAAVHFDTGVSMPQVAAAAEPEVAATAPAKPLKQAFAYEPPPAARAAEKPHRRARSASRLSSRDTRPRLASTQPNWFSW